MAHLILFNCMLVTKNSTILKQKLSINNKLLSSLEILQLSNLDLIDLVNKEVINNNLVVDLENSQVPISKLNSSDFIKYGSYNKENHDELINNIPEKFNLRKNLEMQINIDFSENKEREIALTILDNLDDNGYVNEECYKIVSESYEEILIEKTLIKLQTYEPAGIFARNLKECLLIQVKRKKIYNETFQIIIDNLELIANNKLQEIYKLAKLNKEKLYRYMSKIKCLNPKPGRGIFDEENNINIIPDLILRENNEGFYADLNEESIVKIKISDHYLHKNNNFFNEDLNKARNVIESLKQRYETLLKVTNFIVKKQENFLKFNDDRLILPLTLREIAADIGMHESTVSRAISNKYISTNQGNIPLKNFFSNSISKENDLSQENIKSLVKNIIKQEQVEKRLSDNQITNLLNKKYGITIARRTVAKYRELLGIGSTSERKNEFKSEAFYG